MKKIMEIKLEIEIEIEDRDFGDRWGPELYPPPTTSLLSPSLPLGRSTLTLFPLSTLPKYFTTLFPT